MTGGVLGDWDDGWVSDDYENILTDLILQFDQSIGEWREIGRMLEARWGHAVSVVNWLDVENYCIK